MVLQPWHRPSAELLAVDLPDAAVRRRPLHILCHLPDIFGNHPLLIVQRPHPCGAGDGMLRIGGDSRSFLHEQLPVSGVRPRAGAADSDRGSHRDRFDVAASRFYQMGLRHLFPDGGCEECLHLWHPRRRHRTREGDPQRETDALPSPRLHLPRSGAWSQRHAPDGRAGLRG